VSWFGTAAISLLGMGDSEVRQVGTIAKVIASLVEGKALYNTTQTARSDIAKLQAEICETILINR